MRFKQDDRPKKRRALLDHSSITQTTDTRSNLVEDIGGHAAVGLDEASGDTEIFRRVQEWCQKASIRLPGPPALAVFRIATHKKRR